MGQVRQVAAEAAPAWLPYVPGGHGVHDDGDAAPVVALYVPMGHCAHEELP